MGDSPLSITASVTGILTFAAAILAFIYVRYLTLRNSNDEMNSILISTSASVEETDRLGTLIHSIKAATQHDASQWQLLEDPLTQLEKSMNALFLLETKILSAFQETYFPGSG